MKLNKLSIAAILLTLTVRAYASSGTEGAAFLDIPVGAGPAALGGAYTALANDAYAATWNPAGLGFLDSTQIAGQHLSYLESMNYEYMAFAHPLNDKGMGIGGSIQYLGSGNIAGTDASGNPTGDFSSHYAAYNLAYGQAINDKLSLGSTVKLINAKIDDVSANAFAVDFGSLYKMQKDLTLAASLTNLGSKLKFLDEGDSLPLAFHAAADYQLNHQWNFVTEAVFPKTGLVSGHFGVEWHPIEMLTLRTGYKTDTTKELGALAGYSLGMGLDVWGQEFAYAWVPLGDLGNTQYFSLLIRFGEPERAKRNLIYYQTIKKHRTVKNGKDQDMEPEYQQLMQLLSDDDSHLAQSGSKGSEQ